MSALFSEKKLVKSKYKAYTISLLILWVCILIAPQTSFAGTQPTEKEGKTQIWVEDSFEDFADGTFDASGQNIYINRDGKIRTINRFDLNEDGWIDLLFPSTHDNYSFIP
ncbi:MAG: hypothetical protein KAU83_11080, partial [Bacteroidales bacterium]|nr:hypothetical protein [Bacteroidales bacterium]